MTTEPLVLIPGMMCDGRVFLDQITAFGADRAVQIASCGKHQSISLMAKHVLESAPAKFALAGHQMGGVVAMEVLRMAPDRVMRLAVMSCTPLAETPQEAAARETRIMQARAGHFDEVVRGEVPVSALAPGAGRMAVQASLTEILTAQGGGVFLAQSRAMQRRPDQQRLLRQLRGIPVMVLCGAHDTITPPRRHQFMAELTPHASLSVIETAGHVPPLESPKAVTAAMRQWLAAPYVLN